MEFLYLYEDDGGTSHFEDRSFDLSLAEFAPPAPPLLLSVPLAARSCVFLTLPAGWKDDRHRSPKRQIAVCLAGRLRVRAGDGEERRVGPGEIWWMEDTGGNGHATEVVGEDDVRLAIVQFE